MKLRYGKEAERLGKNEDEVRKNEAGKAFERLKSKIVLPLTAAAAFGLFVSAQGCAAGLPPDVIACSWTDQDKRVTRTKDESFVIKIKSGDTYVGRIIDVIPSEKIGGNAGVARSYVIIDIYDEKGDRLFEGERFYDSDSRDFFVYDENSKQKKINIAVCEIIKVNDKYYAVLGTTEGTLYTPEVDGSDGGSDADGGIIDAGDEAVDAGHDGGVEEDGGMDAGDEAADQDVDGGQVEDGGDQTGDGDAQTCEPQINCNTVVNGPFALFTINNEQIEETESREVCTATAEDCSTAISSETIVLTLSRPLTSDEQQIFSTQYVAASALGPTTVYNTATRQFGNEVAYKENLKGGETLGAVECLTINVSNGVTTMFVKYDNKLYQVKSTDPAKQLGNANISVKVYPGGNAIDGVPVAVLSDVKEAWHDQTVELNGVVYHVTIEVGQDNPNNLAGMKLTR